MLFVLLYLFVVLLPLYYFTTRAHTLFFVIIFSVLCAFVHLGRGERIRSATFMSLLFSLSAIHSHIKNWMQKFIPFFLFSFIVQLSSPSSIKAVRFRMVKWNKAIYFCWAYSFSLSSATTLTLDAFLNDDGIEWDTMHCIMGESVSSEENVCVCTRIFFPVLHFDTVPKGCNKCHFLLLLLLLLLFSTGIHGNSRDKQWQNAVGIIPIQD